MEVPNERTHGGVYCGAASEEKESNEEESRDGGRKKRYQRRRVETKELLKKSTSISISKDISALRVSEPKTKRQFQCYK